MFGGEGKSVEELRSFFNLPDPAEKEAAMNLKMLDSS